MLIIMPNGHGTGPGEPDRAPAADFEYVERDLLRDVMPAVESLYRIEPGSRHRAVAGASMGGYQALEYGLRHSELFGNVGVFSAGAHGPEGSRRVAEAADAG